MTEEDKTKAYLKMIRWSNAKPITKVTDEEANELNEFLILTKRED